MKKPKQTKSILAQELDKDAALIERAVNYYTSCKFSEELTEEKADAFMATWQRVKALAKAGVVAHEHTANTLLSIQEG